MSTSITPHPPIPQDDPLTERLRYWAGRLTAEGWTPQDFAVAARITPVMARMAAARDRMETAGVAAVQRASR